MYNINNKDLFNLIKSLTKNEKRYLKVNAGNHKDSNLYILLFNIFDTAKKFDDKILKLQFEKEIGVKNISFTKNYLYNYILEQLTNYHSQQSAKTQLKQIMVKVEILFNKGLSQLALKLLEKAEKLAIENEKHQDLFEILEWKEMIFVQTGRVSESLEIHNLQLECFRKTENKFLIRNIAIQFHRKSIFVGNRKMAESEQELKKTLENTIELKDFIPDSTEAKYYWYSIFLNYYSFINYNKAKIYYNQKINDLLENNKFYIKENPNKYVGNLQNLNNQYFDLKQYDKIKLNVAKMKNLIEEYNLGHILALKNKILSYVMAIELAVNIKTLEIDATLSQIHKIIAELEEKKNSIRPESLIDIYFSLLYISFIGSDLKTAKKLVGKITDHSFKEIRQDIQVVTKIIQLILFYESNDFWGLELFLKNTLKFIDKSSKMNPIESLITHFLESEIKSKNTNKDILIEMKNQFSEYEKNEILAEYFELFDFKSWVIAKIENKTFRQVLREVNRTESHK